ncbi:hypothetical protein [Nocardioides cynanchi]|uniref:hypothetical protein n=1 Tax=Nocardioides cynanchi TaxID=2558918 RepID=UPI001248C30A|nr:hypothetical protein [Nocardioides cynanchi]
MIRTPALAALALTGALTAAVAGTTASTASGAAPSHRQTAAVGKGGPGHWTKVSTGGVQSIFMPSLVKSSDGVLHVVYPENVPGGMQLGHTALDSHGRILRQNDVLPTAWENVDRRPVVLSTSTGLRIVFTGNQTPSGPTFWDHGLMYTATGDQGGSSWALPAESLGSNAAVPTYGTGAVMLADGTTPVGAYADGDVKLSWHIGVGNDPDASYTTTSPGIFDTTLVRDGGEIWAGWYQNGSTAATNGTFAMRIYPTVGTPLKAPQSSGGASSHTTGRVALAARSGGGVFEAYCAGSALPCTSLRVWKVGSAKTSTIPQSKGATRVALSPGPSGRLWVAWTSSAPQVKAVRTGATGLVMGAVRNAGLPPRADLTYGLGVDGTRARGDLVVNVGNALWHTQVLPGLTLHASPRSWQHGGRQKVVFSVTDARAGVAGSKVRVGSKACTTGKGGTCTLTFPASFGKGKHAATAARKGYAKAATRLTVK